MPITPTPLSGTFYSASGGVGATSPSTSTSGTYGGPWAIERQELKIDYYRVPVVWNTSPDTITLSGDYVVSADYQDSTELVYKVTASYSMVKNYASFDTSSFVQSQTFELNADTHDLRGTAYGTIDASTMGPAGSIVTNRPYYRRVLWDDDIHTEVSRQIEGYNIASYKRGWTQVYGNETTGFDVSVGPAFGRNINTAWGRMELYPDPAGKGSFTGDDDHHVSKAGPDYQIFGNYSTDKDNLNLIFNFITSVGNKLKTTKSYTNGAGSGVPLITGGFFRGPFPVMMRGELSVNDQQVSIPIEPAMTEYITEYDPSRHEY